MTERTYIYKRPTGYYFYILMLISIIGVYGFAFYRVILAKSRNFQNAELIFTIAFGILLILIIYVLIQIVLMYQQYDAVDHDKIVEVNNNERSMNIRQNDGENILVRNEDIKNVEVFEPWSATYPLGYFSYIKINLKQNSSITITGYTLPLGEFELMKVLKGVKRTRHIKFFNKIK